MAETMVLPGWPVFDADERAAVDAVLSSGRVNYWTGQEGRQFERDYAAYAGVPYAVAVANGTLALELALMALDIGPGDEVVVPCRTFMATASSVAMRGAIPVFADVDPLSQNVTATTLGACITERTRALIVVHLAGWPCDMDPIMSLARSCGLPVIEDCAQAHGAFYQGQPVGSIGDIGCFSFCQDKIITTGGEGGMLLTRDEPLWRRAWEFKDHGKSWDKMTTPGGSGGFRYVHDSIGSNWRLTELQAAIGRLQLQKLPAWQARRSRTAQILAEALRAAGLVVPLPAADCVHAWYKLYALAPSLAEREAWLAALHAAGVPAFTGSCPEVYREQAFRTHPQHGVRLPVAAQLADTTLLFQVHPSLDDRHAHWIADQIRSVGDRLRSGQAASNGALAP